MTIAEALTIGGVGYEVDYQRAKSLVLDELKSGNVEAEIQLQLIRTLEPKDLAELIEAQQSLIRLSDMGHEDAMYALLQLESSEHWYEDIGKHYSYEQDPEIAADYGLRLLDSSFGVSRLIDAVYYDTFKILSVKQMEPIVQRLSEIANDSLKLIPTSIDASVLLSHT